MIKVKSILILFVFFGALLFPKAVSAQYVQPVLGVKAPEEKTVHEPVDAGIADNPLAVGATLLAASGSLFYLAKRKARPQNIIYSAN